MAFTSWFSVSPALFAGVGAMVVAPAVGMPAVLAAEDERARGGRDDPKILPAAPVKLRNRRTSSRPGAR